MSFQTGIDQLLNSEDLLTQLKNRSCALVAHPASITYEYTHSLDALIRKGCSIKKAFGPQHGMRGDKQDNMIETEDYLDSRHQIPVVSLYGAHRKPTEEMLAGIDLILFDLQDVGCRIYTYITTLLYFLEACSENDIEIWVLDRPNPAGRPIDGLTLIKGEESFVGCAPIPTRHGLTIGELANWLVAHNALSTNLKVIEMVNYAPESPVGHGWSETRPWINPSPNANSINMARCFAGTVLLEGVNLSEGRGTTIPLEVIGAPHLPINEMLDLLNNQANEWTQGVYLRTCYFEPTFHKFQGEMCAGLQIHTDIESYAHETFKPYRLIAGLLKALKLIQPSINLWRNHYYEYEHHRLPIDVINGGSELRFWIDNGQSDFDEFDKRLTLDEKAWKSEREAFLIY
ncbi:MAG: DUF1343 domain-containing protein [Pseudomonadales bacterium]|nr:DUF1343 domain-containing protein [Pseudomonadales bacterium]